MIESPFVFTLQELTPMGSLHQKPPIRGVHVGAHIRRVLSSTRLMHVYVFNKAHPRLVEEVLLDEPD